MRLVGSVVGRVAIIVDDMADTCGASLPLRSHHDTTRHTRASLYQAPCVSPWTPSRLLVRLRCTRTWFTACCPGPLLSASMLARV
jgi:hypothetical protein